MSTHRGKGVGRNARNRLLAVGLAALAFLVVLVIIPALMIA